MREEMLSVGIDVGTSTTQLVFSRLGIENMASNYTVPRIEIVDKTIVYRSEIHFTPLVSETRLAAEQLREIIAGEYRRAGVAPSQVDTGAVIITGETARKENASEVLASLSGLAGDFVVATAGPDLESVIAGKGAGADRYAREQGRTVLNIDIGGGTSNLVVFNAQGEAVDTGCYDIGGRLVKIDQASGQITYIMPKLQRLIQAQGLSLAVGDRADADNIRPLAAAMAEVLVQAAGLSPETALSQSLQTNKGLGKGMPIEAVTFSGGVADYIYQPDAGQAPFRYGDIGILLGQAVAASALCRQLPVLRGAETIRATVVGAGSHTMEISGSTISYSKDLFPLKNVPVLKIPLQAEDQLTQRLTEKHQWFGGELVAVGLTGVKNPTYAQISGYAQSLARGLDPVLPPGQPLIVVLQHDMAMVLGQTLQGLVRPGRDIVCLDGVRVEDGDYIDIGKPVAEGRVLPVVVKTIVFNK